MERLSGFDTPEVWRCLAFALIKQSGGRVSLSRDELYGLLGQQVRAYRTSEDAVEFIAL